MWLPTFLRRKPSTHRYEINGEIAEEDWSTFVGEERRLKEELHLKCLAPLDFKKGMKQNVFRFLINCRTIVDAREILQEHHVCKGEFCEILIGDMPLEISIHDFSFEIKIGKKRKNSLLYKIRLMTKPMKIVS